MDSLADSGLWKADMPCLGVGQAAGGAGDVTLAIKKLNHGQKSVQYLVILGLSKALIGARMGNIS